MTQECYLCHSEGDKQVSDGNYLCEECLVSYINVCSEDEIRAVERLNKITYYSVSYNSLCSSDSGGRCVFYTDSEEDNIYILAISAIGRNIKSQCRNYQICSIRKI